VLSSLYDCLKRNGPVLAMYSKRTSLDRHKHQALISGRNEVRDFEKYSYED